MSRKSRCRHHALVFSLCLLGGVEGGCVVQCGTTWSSLKKKCFKESQVVGQYKNEGDKGKALANFPSKFLFGLPGTGGLRARKLFTMLVDDGSHRAVFWGGGHALPL